MDNYNLWKEQIDEVFLSENKVSAKKVNNLLNKLSSTDSLNDFLCDVLRSKENLKKIASQSYFHQNNFDKIVLLASDNWNLRIHIWDNQLHNADFIGDNDIHNHKWIFYSTILKGSVKEEEYKLETNPIAFNSIEYNYENQELNRVKPVCIKKKSEIIIQEKEFYYRTPSQLHKIFPNSDYAVTLVLTGKPEVDKSNVYYFEEQEIVKKKIRKYKSKDLENRLSKFLNLL